MKMILVLSMWISASAFASNSVSDAQFEMLAGAKSIAELREAVAHSGSVQALARDCELELAMKRVPVACFAEARLRKSHGLLNFEDHERKVRALSSFCRQISRSNQDLKQLSAALKSETLSVSCRKTVQRRVEDLDYQIGEVRDLDRFLN